VDLAGEIAAICGVSALDRATSPLFGHFRAASGHLGRQIHQIYEFMT